MPALKLVTPAPWMNTEEKKVFKNFVRATQKMLEDNDVAETPLLQLRVDELVVSLILVRLAESHLQRRPETPDDQPVPFAILEAVGKVRERLRKAVKDLEDHCAGVGTPINIGIADAMKPVLERVGPTLERLWQFEAD